MQFQQPPTLHLNGPLIGGAAPGPSSSSSSPDPGHQLLLLLLSEPVLLLLLLLLLSELLPGDSRLPSQLGFRVDPRPSVSLMRYRRAAGVVRSQPAWVRDGPLLLREEVEHGRVHFVQPSSSSLPPWEVATAAGVLGGKRRRRGKLIIES